jgi:hypothetical protein
MSDIRIGPLAQLVIVAGFLAAVAAAIATQVPEIQRYLKVRKM